MVFIPCPSPGSIDFPALFGTIKWNNCVKGGHEVKKYIYDVPENQGVANVLKRAKQLADVTWIPLRKMPCSTIQRPTADSKAVYLPSHTGTNVPMTGMIYSSCRLTEKYVGYNVSLETFVTATQNPNSVLYTKTLHGTGGNAMGSWYGTVCSAFVSYCLDMPRISCRLWFQRDDVVPVSRDDADSFRLGDIVVNYKHIGIITALGRDQEGHVQTVTVAESVVPTVRVLEYPLKNFYDHWDDYEIRRYVNIDKVPYTPTPYVYVDGDPDTDVPDFQIMTNWGNRANCLMGQEPVELSVIKGDWDTFEMTHPDGTVKAYKAGQAVLVDTPIPGLYTAVGKQGENTTEPVTWYCYNISCKTDKTVYKVDEPITLTFESTEKDPVCMWLINRDDNYLRIRGDVTEKNTATVPGISVAGHHWGIVMAKNQFGIYKSQRVDFEVEEAT